MGSGFSACTGPSSVGVTDLARPGGHQNLNKSGGGVHSDSCDSGISISEGNRRNKTRTHTAVTSHHVTDLDSEDEMVEGNDVACGTDFVMTSTPRPASPKPFDSDYDGRRSASSLGLDTRKSRLHAHSAKSLRHNAHSSPNLLDHAIHEEDEEAHDGEPEDKRLRAQRPPRPKSAHFRKSRAQAHRGRTARSRGHASSTVGSVSGGESSADLTSDDEDFDSDVLSIPDETHNAHSERPGTLTTVKLGPQFQAQTRISDTTTIVAAGTNPAGDVSHNDDTDWWTEDDGAGTARTRDDGPESSRSRGSSFTLRSNSRVWPEGRVAKKASERSISSILLTTAVELDSTPASGATNPACFAVTNPEITQHILKVSKVHPKQRSSTNTTTTTTLAAYTHSFTDFHGDSPDGSISRARRDLGLKLRQLFMVRPATEVVKTTEKSLQPKIRRHITETEVQDGRRSPERDHSRNAAGMTKSTQVSQPHKSRGLFVVAEDEGESPRTDWEAFDAKLDLDAEDGCSEPRSINRRTHSQTLLISSGISESVTASGQSRNLRSLLISSRSERTISSDPPNRLKKRVSFSPDIPDVYKCSKTYRRRTIAFIRMRNARLAQSRGRSQGLFTSYVCSLCQEDCIRRIVY